MLEIQEKRTRYRANVDWTGGFLSINLDQMASRRKLKWQRAQRAARKDVFNKFICVGNMFVEDFSNEHNKKQIFSAISKCSAN